jgi:hypothetical protein
MLSISPICEIDSIYFTYSATEYQNTVFLRQLTMWFCCSLPALLENVFRRKAFHFCCSKLALWYQSKLRHANIDSRTLHEAMCTAVYIGSAATHACFVGRTDRASRTPGLAWRPSRGFGSHARCELTVVLIYARCELTVVLIYAVNSQTR